MTPTKGRIVLALVMPETNNGDDTAPAVITRVWGEHPTGGHVVNLKVLNDSMNNEWKTSVILRDTEEEARSLFGSLAAFWPAR